MCGVIATRGEWPDCFETHHRGAAAGMRLICQPLLSVPGAGLETPVLDEVVRGLSGEQGLGQGHAKGGQTDQLFHRISLSTAKDLSLRS